MQLPNVQGSVPKRIQVLSSHHCAIPFLKITLAKLSISPVKKVKSAECVPTFCDPMDQPIRPLCPWDFCEECWSGLPFLQGSLLPRNCEPGSPGIAGRRYRLDTRGAQTPVTVPGSCTHAVYMEAGITPSGSNLTGFLALASAIFPLRFLDHSTSTNF